VREFKSMLAKVIAFEKSIGLPEELSPSEPSSTRLGMGQ
jgi:hypothetical protein